MSTAVVISANAADPGGAVVRVEFYAGSTLVGSDTSAPYSVTWNGAAAGSYSLTAKAVDNAGASTTSVAANLTVTGAEAPGTGTGLTGQYFCQVRRCADAGELRRGAGDDIDQCGNRCGIDLWLGSSRGRGPKIDRLLQYTIRRRNRRGVSRIAWAADQEAEASHVAQNDDTGLRQVAANLVLLFGRDCKIRQVGVSPLHFSIDGHE